MEEDYENQDVMFSS